MQAVVLASIPGAELAVVVVVVTVAPAVVVHVVQRVPLDGFASAV